MWNELPDCDSQACVQHYYESQSITVTVKRLLVLKLTGS